MGWNGAGTFVRPMNWASDKAAAINITASRMDTDTNDIVTNGLGNCITRDGQGQPTANLPMATFRHTGVADGVSRTDYAAVGQTQDGKLNWVAAGGSADALAATYIPALATLVDGQLCHVRAVAANATTTPTFAPNGLTARTITKIGGAALAVADINATGHEIILRYNLANTRWELLNPAAPIVYSNDAGAGVGPSLDLYRDSASPAASDFIGSVDFNGRDSGATKQLYARIISQITDPTAASEDAILLLQQVIAGTLTSILTSSASGIALFGSLAIVGPLSGVTTVAMNGAISGVTAPTVQRFTSGSAQTYTAPAGCVRQRVRIIGPGGGGGGATANVGSNGSAATSFQVNATGTAWTAAPGTGGGTGNGLGGAGGTGGTDGSTGTKIVRFDGGRGSSGNGTATANTQIAGGLGGSGPFGGAGSGGVNGTAGQVASTNTGGGGGGGGPNSGTNSGGGGGSGEYVEFWVTGMTTATYSVPAGGNGGAAGTNAGGNGASGIIIVEEFYS